MNEPAPGSVWYHPKSGSHYLALAVATCATNGRFEGERAVIYYDVTHPGTAYYRRLSEFLDGRFVEMSTAHIPA